MSVPIVDDLIRLMEIQSPTGEEEAIARFLRDRIALAHRPVAIDGRSVVVPPVADDARPLVLLAGHVDTVPARGNAIPRRDGAWIWGRGAVDMKGGLAVILSLLDDQRVGAGWARVGALLYAGEEGPAEGNDLGRLLEGPAHWGCRAAFGILLEPTGDGIEVGCVGAVNAAVIFRGVPCHSARPWLGRSAVDAALPFLERIASFSPREHSVSGFAFRETAVVTTLHAGTARNVVPGDLTANLNYRFPPGCDVVRALANVHDLAREADEVRIVDLAPAGAIPIDSPLFAAFLERSGRPARAKQGWTDVARLSSLGVPALNFGPGDPGLCHTDDERTTVEALEECRGTLSSFLTGEGPFGRRLGP